MTGSTLIPSEVEFLRPYVDAGVFDAGEVQLCAAVARLVPGATDDALLGLAVAARGPRLGHVCIELDDVDRLVIDRAGEAGALRWPDVDRWTSALHAAPFVSIAGGPDDQRDDQRDEQGPSRPLVWDGRLYLQRMHRAEVAVADELRRRGTDVTTTGDGDVVPAGECSPGLESILDDLFGPAPVDDVDLQREAARAALTGRITVVAGGPGTGKTHTIARMLAAAHALSVAQGRTLDVALAAPTGKAASRMTEALHAAALQAQADGTLTPEVVLDLTDRTAVTLHRLLGAVPGKGFRRGRHNPLPHDLVIIDETSMVSLPLMDALLSAVRPSARIVLVGDPDQLASIEAGSVMGDIVGPREPSASDDHPLAGHVITLTRSRRFDEDSPLGNLASAIRSGDATKAVEILDGDSDEVRWIRTDRLSGVDAALIDEVVTAGMHQVEVGKDLAADETVIEASLIAMRQVKVLAATRHGDLGLYDWTARIEAEIEQRVPGLRTAQQWYPGRPVLVTQNDSANRLTNGDVGLVVHRPDGVAVAFTEAGTVRMVAPSRLDRIETWWAMTIHKSQGSEFDHAIVSLPGSGAPILTRELLYTAVTRGKPRVTIVGSEEALRAAIAQPVARASGLRDRLWPA